MDNKEKRIDNFRLGYLQAVADYTNFLQNLPARHGSKILFNKDVYAEECNQFNKDALTRATLRAEEIIGNIIAQEESKQKESKF